MQSILSLETESIRVGPGKKKDCPVNLGQVNILDSSYDQLRHFLIIISSNDNYNSNNNSNNVNIEQFLSSSCLCSTINKSVQHSSWYEFEILIYDRSTGQSFTRANHYSIDRISEVNLVIQSSAP